MTENLEFLQQVHQPIFGANYITGESIEGGKETIAVYVYIALKLVSAGSRCLFTMTFNQGGATDFARAFFRITEGTKIKVTLK